MGCASSAPHVDSTPAARGAAAPAEPRRPPHRWTASPGAALPNSPRLSLNEGADINPFSAALEAAGAAADAPAHDDETDTKVRQLEGLLACPRQALPASPKPAPRSSHAAQQPPPTPGRPGEEPNSDDDDDADLSPVLVLHGFLDTDAAASSAATVLSPKGHTTFATQHSLRGRGCSSTDAAVLAQRTESVLRYSPRVREGSGPQSFSLGLLSTSTGSLSPTTRSLRGPRA